MKRVRTMKLEDETWADFWEAWRESGLTQDEFIKELMEQYGTNANN